MHGEGRISAAGAVIRRGCDARTGGAQKIVKRIDAPLNAAKGTLVNNAAIKRSNESPFERVNEMLAPERATP